MDTPTPEDHNFNWLRATEKGMPLNNKPAFDWVSARAMCTAKTLFNELKKVVEADVRSANNNVADKFEIHQEPSDGVFSVHLNSEDGQMVIRQRTFELVEQNILVYKTSTESDVFLRGRASLTETKDCLIEVEQKTPMRLWEFSFLALEDFFFAGR